MNIAYIVVGQNILHSSDLGILEQQLTPKNRNASVHFVFGF